MATRAGAAALGLDDTTGTLEVGKDADIAMVNIGGLHFVPVMHGRHFNAPAHLVFTASARDVSDVWVQGSRLMQDGQVTSVDVAAVAAEAQAAAEELFERREALKGNPAVPLW